MEEGFLIQQLKSALDFDSEMTQVNADWFYFQNESRVNFQTW